ncbi:ABC transporter ATP-binding protein [Cohnella abietis]|uniref:ABC transporter ATP-binding protein n=1 Tax=Cohnella abietis TaxID=2507935 RepID=A0A3T1DBQ5_9BACL|nr:ATP-binding cassette domain-containing protein [Cohnella abietis]BBI35571.1 ABC transporter ATP-binding protein [Cohnella abietis]
MSIEEKPLLRLEGIVKHFTSRDVKQQAGGKKSVAAVDGVSLTIHRNEIIALVGESGSGKSTLGRIAVGLEVPDAGKVIFHDSEWSGSRKQIPEAWRGKRQMVFQSPHSSLNPRHTIADSLAEPLRLAGWERSRTERRISTIMEWLMLPEKALERYPHQFSGGQLQRIAIGRAIAAEPELIVADEPVASLDTSTQIQILELFKTIRQETSVACLFITHGLQTVRWLADQMAVMKSGKLVEVSYAETFFSQPQHPYSRSLLEAVPVPDPTRNRISGDEEGDG